MKFESFSIKNFKGIREATVDLKAQPQSKVYTLVGLNESGKTTVLEAINFFKYKAEDLDPLNLPGYSIKDVHSVIPLGEKSNFNGKVSIIATLTIEPEDRTALGEFLLKTHGTKLINVKDSLVIEQQYVFEDSVLKDTNNFWTFHPVVRVGKGRTDKVLTGKDPLWQEAINLLKKRAPSILYFPNFLFELPDRIYLEPKTGSDDAVHEFYKTVLQDILDSLNEGLNVEKHILLRIKSKDQNQRDSLDQTLSKASSAVTKNVFTRWNALFNKQATGREIRIQYGIDEESVPYLYLRLKEGDELYDVSQRSLGFRWFFAFLLLTYYRGFRKEATENVLFLFDEPASNLHSTAQAELLKSFGQFPDKCRVLYTTHSHHLINPEWLEGTYVVRNEGLRYDDEADMYDAAKSKVTLTKYREFVSKNPSLVHFFQPILDVLEYRPSNLEMVPALIMAEGKNDYYTLAFQQANTLKSNLPIFPGTGSGTLDTAIQLYAAWGRHFVILLDSDGEGKKQRKRYQDLFGPIVEGRIFELADVDPSFAGKELEEVLDLSERLTFQQSAYPQSKKFDKKTFNRAVQEQLMSPNAKVSFGPISAANLNKILTFLEEKLNGQ